MLGKPEQRSLGSIWGVFSFSPSGHPQSRDGQNVVGDSGEGEVENDALQAFGIGFSAGHRWSSAIQKWTRCDGTRGYSWRSRHGGPCAHRWQTPSVSWPHGESQARLGIGHRGMGVITTLRSPKVRSVSVPVFRILGLKGLLGRSGLQQRAIHRKMLVRKPIPVLACSSTEWKNIRTVP